MNNQFRTQLEIKEMVLSLIESTTLIWKIIFCTMPLDVGVVVYLIEKFSKTLKTNPLSYNLYIYILLFLGMILPFLVEPIIEVYRTKGFSKRKNLLKYLGIAASVLVASIIAFAISEKISLGEVLGQTLAGLAILGTIFPILQGLLTSKNLNSNMKAEKLLLILTLAPSILLRVCAVLLAMQTVFIDQSLYLYLSKWCLVCFLMILAAPQADWFKSYLKN
ncbi:MAG: hypothetical protein R3A13_11655 [Bdellovibrionota bacterium]